MATDNFHLTTIKSKSVDVDSSINRDQPLICTSKRNMEVNTLKELLKSLISDPKEEVQKIMSLKNQMNSIQAFMILIAMEKDIKVRKLLNNYNFQQTKFTDVDVEETIRAHRVLTFTSKKITIGLFPKVQLEVQGACEPKKISLQTSQPKKKSTLQLRKQMKNPSKLANNANLN